MLLIATRISSWAFNSGFILTDKRVLNSGSYRYVVANGMSAASAVSQSLENIMITEQQCSSKIVSQFVFKEHYLNAVLEDLF